MAEERLQKLIARAGIASRRKAEELIVAGRVRVGGRTVTVLGATADPERDRIEVDGRRLFFAPPSTYVLYKPRGVIASVSDPEGRKTVLHLMRSVRLRVFPVGRLEYNTSGALLLTSDGELANGLLHPRRHVPRVYRVKVKSPVPEPALARWVQGLEIDGRVLKPARVAKIDENPDNTWLSVTIFEGHGRQLERACELLELRLMRLTRYSFAGISIEGMAPGEYRQLERSEISLLRTFIAHPEPRTRLAPPPAEVAEALPEERRGEEDDGTWAAWNEGTVWELFEGDEPGAVEAAVADGVVRRAHLDDQPAPPTARDVDADHGGAPARYGRLEGKFEEEEGAEGGRTGLTAETLREGSGQAPRAQRGRGGSGREQERWERRGPPDRPPRRRFERDQRGPGPADRPPHRFERDGERGDRGEWRRGRPDRARFDREPSRDQRPRQDGAARERFGGDGEGGYRRDERRPARPRPADARPDHGHPDHRGPDRGRPGPPRDDRPDRGRPERGGPDRGRRGPPRDDRPDRGRRGPPRDDRPDRGRRGPPRDDRPDRGRRGPPRDDRPDRGGPRRHGRPDDGRGGRPDLDRPARDRHGPGRPFRGGPPGG
ncbi:MAG: pseudouridine synthase, partial [Deltaproteobacteria bacterium]|nr:pseudouridine synthase [Deltaproteobacteria bacterium]